MISIKNRIKRCIWAYLFNILQKRSCVNCVFKFLSIFCKVSSSFEIEKDIVKDNNNKEVSANKTFINSLYLSNLDKSWVEYIIKSKRYHKWHLVSPSPWPFFSSISAFFLVLGFVFWMYKIPTSLFDYSPSLFQVGVFLILYTMFLWFRDIVREGFLGYHTSSVLKNLRLGFILFIVSEVMFFFSFFWAYFHFSIDPSIWGGDIWPPEGIVFFWLCEDVSKSGISTGVLSNYLYDYIKIPLTSGFLIKRTLDFINWDCTWFGTDIYAGNYYYNTISGIYENNFGLQDSHFDYIHASEILLNRRATEVMFGEKRGDILSYSKFMNLDLREYSKEKRVVKNSSECIMRTRLKIKKEMPDLPLLPIPGIVIPPKHTTFYDLSSWLPVESICLERVPVFVPCKIDFNPNAILIDGVFPDWLEDHRVLKLLIHKRFKGNLVRYFEPFFYLDRDHLIMENKLHIIPEISHLIKNKNYSRDYFVPFNFHFNLYDRGLLINPFKIPLLNTCILLTSGAWLTLSHIKLKKGNYIQSLIFLAVTLIFAVLFVILQFNEYIKAGYGINDTVYGSIFYMLTGFHGFHVLVGTIFLLVCLIRLHLEHFTPANHLGFEAAIWYWHFVDVVRVFLYIFVYLWPGFYFYVNHFSTNFYQIGDDFYNIFFDNVSIGVNIDYLLAEYPDSIFNYHKSWNSKVKFKIINQISNCEFAIENMESLDRDFGFIMYLFYKDGIIPSRDIEKVVEEDILEDRKDILESELVSENEFNRLIIWLKVETSKDFKDLIYFQKFSEVINYIMSLPFYEYEIVSNKLIDELTPITRNFRSRSPSIWSFSFAKELDLISYFRILSSENLYSKINIFSDFLLSKTDDFGQYKENGEDFKTFNSDHDINLKEIEQMSKEDGLAIEYFYINPYSGESPFSDDINTKDSSLDDDFIYEDIIEDFCIEGFYYPDEELHNSISSEMLSNKDLRW